MANICEYKVLVMGAKNACYAFFGSMSAYDKCIVEEKGTDSKYELIFEGNCKWGVDAYCEKPWAEAVPVSLPADAQEALRLAEEKYAFYSVRERSRMFGVTVYCNSADIDEGEEIIYAECNILDARRIVWNPLNVVYRDRRTDLYDAMLGTDIKPLAR